MASNVWHRYLTWMLASVFVTLVTCAAFNALIDPMGIFGAPRIAGLNATKPHLDHHRDLTRWKAAKRLCPRAGIFGNSRAEIGFDPEHPAFGEIGVDAFNHAIPGTSVGTAFRQLRWLQAEGCAPEVMIVGVDFFDFLGSPQSRLHDSERIPPPQIDLRVLAETLFSVTGLLDSFNTVAIQNLSHPASLSKRGFNALLNYVPEVERAGHYALFRQRAIENVRNWSRKEKQIRPAGGGVSVEYANLDALLRAATEAPGAVHVVIYPYHAQIRVMMERAGLGELFGEWKASVLAAAGRNAAANTAVKVWDFSGLSPEITEEIPPPGDRKTHLTYYWEAGHFKKSLGDKVLDRVLLNRGSFGVRLETRTIDDWLAADRMRFMELASGSSSLAREVDDILASNSNPRSPVRRRAD